MSLDISLSPEVLFYIGSWPITNSFFWFAIVTFFLVLVATFSARRIRLVPGKFQNLMEMLIEGAFDFIVSVTGDERKARQLFPLIFTMFFFVFFSGLLVYIPGQSAISLQTEGGVVPLFRAIVADYGLVFVMTMISVILAQLVAIATVGPLRYIGKFFNFSSPLNFFLGLMDLVGELAKVMSLSFRLFGNIFAGEVLGAVMLFLFPFFLPLPFMFLGLLTTIVQPFVFSVLTLVFVSMASDAGVEELTEAESI